MGEWFRAALIRAIKTVAQTAAATIGTGQVLDKVSMTTTVTTSIGAGLLSFLTSLAGLPEVKKNK